MVSVSLQSEIYTSIMNYSELKLNDTFKYPVFFQFASR